MNRNQAILALKAAQLKAGHLYETRKCYRGWLLRYIDGTRAGHFSDFQGFLDHLSTVAQVNPKTVKQALNALVFFHRKVLGQEPGKLHVPKVNRHRHPPTWLSHGEAVDLISRMRGQAKLQAGLLYGTGARIRSMLTLRLKDLDLEAGLVTYRFDKGGKSRTLRLPQTLLPALTDHVAYIRGRWEEDHRAGLIAPPPEPSLLRKLGRSTFSTLPWYWLFPSQKVRDGARWHATARAIEKAIKLAAGRAGLTKRVTPHTLRHSHATALLHRGENICAIRDQLGHAELETTAIYTHAVDGPVASPLDAPAAVIPFPQAPRRSSRTA